MSQDEKVRTHVRILASAARLIRQHGIDQASVSDVMADAGLTHGGFYKHFDSKDDLTAAALERAFAEIIEKLAVETTDGGHAPNAVFRAFYLSDDHVKNPSLGCPVAALGGDVARAARDLKVRFGAGVRRIVDLLSRDHIGSDRDRRARAVRQFAMMAGAVMIARASDPETAQEILVACRERLE